MKKALRRLIYYAVLLPELLSAAIFAQTSPPYRLNSSPKDFEVDSIAPKRGPAWGGTTVTIYGKKFLPNSNFEVRFGGIRGANVTRLDNQTLSVKSPRYPLIKLVPDTLEITVTDLSETPNVTKASPDSFIYVRPATKLSLLPASANFNGTVELIATLRDSLNNPVDSQMVTFTLGGLLAGTAMTDTSGSAKLSVSISGAGIGVHAGYIGASFAENFFYKPSTAAAADLTVKGTPAELTLNSPVVTYGESIELKAVLTSSGTPLSSKTVSFLINNNPAGTAVTQSDGSATFNISQPMDAGTYNIKATFAEDGYDNSSAEGTLTIKQITTGITVEKVETSPGSIVSLTAKLTANGTAVKNETITFSIDGGASLGTAPTNDEGVATLGGVNLGTLGITPGTHTISAAFAGNTNYTQSTGTNELIISQEATEISITSLEADYGSTITLSAKLKSKTTGLGIKDAVVNFAIEGGPQIEPATTDANGEVSKSVNLGNTGPGTHTLTASFAGMGSYGPSQATGTLTIKQAPAATKVQVEKSTGAYGGKTTLSARLTTSAGVELSGMMLHFKLNGVDIGDSLTNAGGVAMLHGVSIAGIDAGLHENYIEVSFSPQGGGYTPSSGKGALEVTQAATVINTNNIDAEFGSTITLTATLTSSVTGNGIGNETVNFTIEGGPAVEPSQTNSAGAATRSISLGSTAPGQHNVTVSFGGSTNFTASHKTAVLTITQTQTGTTLSVSNVETSGGTVTLTAKLTSSATGNGIPNETVSFSFNDGPAVGTGVTDENGIASLPNVTVPANLGPGLHQGAIKASYAGSSKYLPSTGTGDLKINKAQTSITVSSASGEYGGSVNLRAILKSGDEILTGQTIKFYLNDAPAGDIPTGSNGAANISASLGSINAGTYPAGVRAEFGGSDKYSSISGTNSLTVTQAPTSLSLKDAEAGYGTTVTLSATLTSTVTKSGIADKSVSFVIQGGPHVTATTDGNGVAAASVDLGSTAMGTHDITVSFSPSDGNYTGSTGKATLTVKGNTTSLALKDGMGYYGGTITLEATLTSSGAGLQGKTIKFSFNNKTYYPETDQNGVARVGGVSIAGFEVGTYPGVISAEFAGTGGYGYSSATGNLTVDKAATALKVADVTGESNGKVDLSAVLTSESTKLKGMTVRFQLNNSPAGEAITNDLGVATVYGVTLQSNLIPGPHPGAIAAVFEETKNYFGVQGSGNLTVTQTATKIQVAKSTGSYGGKADLSAKLTTSSDIPLGYMKLHFKLNGADINDAYTDAGGVAVLAGISIAGIDAGLHENFIQVSFSPANNSYTPSAANGPLEVTPAATSISISNMEADFGSTVTLTARLLSSVTGNGIEGRTIIFKIDGVEAGSAVTGADGKAYKNYYLGNTSPGYHTFEAFFSPSGGNYTGSSAKASLNVKSSLTTLAVKNIIGVYGGTVTLEAVLTSSGVPLGGKTISFTVQGKSAGSALTGSDGKAYVAFSLAGIDAGFYAGAIKADFAGQGGYQASSGKGDLTVKQISTSLAVKTVSGTFGGTVDLSATLTSGAFSLTGRTISFKMNGAFVGTASTGTNGVATLQGVSLSGINAGTYYGIIEANFAASGNYGSSSASGNLTVNPAPTTTLVQKATGSYSGKVSLTARLTVSSTGNALSGRTLLFRLNGVDKGSAVTDNSGVAVLADVSIAGIDIGTYNDYIEASFSPSGGNYLSSSGKGQLEVGLAPTSIAVEKVKAVYGSSVTLKATLTSQGVSLSGKTVEFTLNNVSVGTAVTDIYGIAVKANVSLAGIPAGIHIGLIGASFTESSPFKGCSGRADLEITKASTSVVVLPVEVQYSDKVTLTAVVISEAQGILNSTGGRVEFKYQLDNEPAISLGVVTAYEVVNGKLNFHYTFICTLAPCTYKILAYFTPADQANFESSCNTSPWGPLVVKPEDAIVEYSGARYFSATSLSSYTSLLIYSSAVMDYPDAFRGNISNARAEFREVMAGELYDNGIVRGTNLPVSLFNYSDQTLGSVTAQPFNRRLGLSEIDKCGTTFSVYTYIYGYYRALSIPALVSVCIPSTENISGGGFIIPNSPAGKYRSLSGSKTSFGFSMKYNKSGKDAQGQVNIIIHGEDNKIYQITANVINILSAYLIKDYPGKAASFNTRADLRDITDPTKPVFLGGGLTLNIEMYDDEKNNENDAIAITLQDPNSALLYSSNWDGSKTVSQALKAPKGGGTIRVLSIDDPVSVEEEEKLIPKEYALYQNYPNPFNPSTNIRFDLPEESRVSIVIYNILGREVATLIDKDFPAGRHQAVWNSQQGSSTFASGIYIFRISAKSLSSEKSLISTKKMMLVK